MAYFFGGTATLTTDGTTGGTFTVDNASFLVEGAICYLNATGLSGLEVQVKTVLGTKVSVRATSLIPQLSGSDVSAYTVVGTATLVMPPQNVWGSMAIEGGASASSGGASSAAAADQAVAQLYGKPVAGKSFNIDFDGTDKTQTLDEGVVYVLTCTQDCFVAFDALATSAANRDFVPAASPYVVSTPTGGTVLHVTQATAAGTLYGAQRQKVT